MAERSSLRKKPLTEHLDIDVISNRTMMVLNMVLWFDVLDAWLILYNLQVF